MPIARVQLPDGRIARFEVPEGTTEQQVLALSQQTFPEPASQLPESERAGFGTGLLEGGKEAIFGALQAGGDIAGRIFPESQGVQEFRELVPEALGMSRQRFEAQQPTFGAEVGRFAGQAAPFIAALPAGGASLVGRLGAGALGGAIAGGTAPTEEQLTPEQALTQRVIQAGQGGALGAVIPAALTGVGKVAGGVSRLFKGRNADQVLANRITTDRASEALGELQKGRISVLADVAGDEVQGFTRAVGKVSGGARNVVADALEGRSEAAVTRVSNALSKNISNVETYFGNLDDLAKARASAASPVYREAYSKGAQLKVNTRLNTLLNDQRIVSAMDESRATLGVSAEARRNSIEAIDGAKKILDDRIGTAFTNNQGELVKATRRLKNELLQEADRQVPKYKEARKIFSDFKSLENSQEAGLLFDRQTPEQLKKLIGLMDNTQKEAFKIGVRQNLQTIVSRTADQADPAKRIFGNQLKRDQLKTIFGEGDQFNAFSRAMREEIRAAKTKFKVLGGSRTDINLADDGQFIPAAVDAVQRGVIRSSLDTAISSIARSMQNRWVGLSNKNAKDLAKILTDRESGIDALQRLINKSEVSQRNILQDAVNELSPLLGTTAAVAAVGER